MSGHSKWNTCFGSGRGEGLEHQEILCPLLGSKCADHLAFHSDHTQITFSLIICKRHERVIRKTADLSLVFAKAVNQCPDFTATWSSTLSYFLFRNRIQINAFFKDLIIIPFQAFHVMIP